LKIILTDWLTIKHNQTYINQMTKQIFMCSIN